ncbi:hypothetical protein [Pseudonocardia lacus]|uniref:hypothetical protein n=1 Tax=Pseudonocardia lacus TaxID=2835865 RepID=UPI001BDC9BD8|nr:hypothetical protein [Pseudonocardia lacus]
MFFDRPDGVWRLYVRPASGLAPTPTASFLDRPVYLPHVNAWMVCHRGNFTWVGWRRVARAIDRYSVGEVAFDSSALPLVARRLIGDGRRNSVWDRSRGRAGQD